MRRGFLMITDAIIAFIVISVSVVVSHGMLLETRSYSRNYLYEVANDAATLIQESELENIKPILNLSPKRFCLKTEIQIYEGSNHVNTIEFSKKECPKEPSGDIVIARRTYANNENNYLITVKGWTNE